MASNTDFTPVFIGTFNGTEVDGNNFNFPSSAESDAGFSNLAQIYPLRFKSSGSITFTASAPNGDVGIYFRFESNPWPKVNPAFKNTYTFNLNSATLTLNGTIESHLALTPFLQQVESISNDLLNDRAQLVCKEELVKYE